MQDHTQTQNRELDNLLSAYKTALESWIGSIKDEETLVSGNHTLAEVDRWEAAHFREEELRDKAKEAKKEYEDALRQKYFNI